MPRRTDLEPAFRLVLRNWVDTHPQASPPAVRFHLRVGPDWRHTATVELTEHHVQHLTRLLQQDMAPQHATRTTARRAAAALEEYIVWLRAIGRRHLRPADVLAFAPRIGRPRPWIAAHLAYLADTGVLRETRHAGVFAL